jgi:hypothetical protein
MMTPHRPFTASATNSFLVHCVLHTLTDGRAMPHCAAQDPPAYRVRGKLDAIIVFTLKTTEPYGDQ